MSLNSYKNQKYLYFKKKVIQQEFTDKTSKITIIPHVKLKGVWFAEEQNKIAVSMFSMTFVIGLIIGIIIGVIL